MSICFLSAADQVSGQLQCINEALPLPVDIDEAPTVLIASQADLVERLLLCKTKDELMLLVKESQVILEVEPGEQLFIFFHMAGADGTSVPCVAETAASYTIFTTEVMGTALTALEMSMPSRGQTRGIGGTIQCRN